MKWKIKQILLKVAIGILALYIAATTYKAYVYDYKEIEPVKIIKQHQEIADSHYIISEHMILGKLQSKSQIVSMEQNLHKKDTHVDENWLGERHTEIDVQGTYKLGMNTSEIKIKHIEQDTGTVYVELGKPILISLELPYDHLEFSKKEGFFRLAASEEEQKNYYKATEKNIENEILKDKNIINQAKINNQEVVRDVLMKLQGVNYIVFE